MIHVLALTLFISIVSASSASVPLHGWRLLAPIPDHTGYAGMIAGVLGERLVAAGGSQFADKPLWLKGGKVFTDRIFALDAVDGQWIESTSRLPVRVANPASAATKDAIYFAGGLNGSGCQRTAWMLRAGAGGFSTTALPDLPRPMGYPAGAIVDGRFYVVGGIDAPSSKAPLTEMWSLDLGEPTAWRREPDAPAPGVFVGAGASDGKNFYLFSGFGFDAAGNGVPSRVALRFSSATGSWERLADMPGPRVGASAPCPLTPVGRIFLIGGYAEVFPGAPREHPGFSAQTLLFDPVRGAYENGPLLPVAPVTKRDVTGDPGPSPMIGAPCVVWKGLAVVIGGEVRSSVRTSAVLACPL